MVSNWSRLSLLDQLGPLAPLAYAPLDFNGTPNWPEVGLQLVQLKPIENLLSLMGQIGPIEIPLKSNRAN